MLEDDIDIEEVSSAPSTLEEYVRSCLDQHVSFENNIAKKKLYGIFYNGVRIKTHSKKVAFNTVGAAKLSLYQCFNLRARILACAKPKDPNAVNISHVAYHDTSYLAEIFKGKNLDSMSKISAFREELLKHVEIRELSDGC
jgi:hypothetical protein